MIPIGRYSQLRIDRETSVGLYLQDKEGEDVLLPHKYCPESYDLDDELEVFVYLDHEERKIATTLKPKITLHQFSFLKVVDVNPVGAFLDWGLEKDLLVPFREQRKEMEKDRWYVVFLDIDRSTDRLFASNKIEKYLSNEDLSIKKGEEVDLLIYHESPMAFSAIINNEHKGLVYKNEVVESLRVGSKTKGYIKKIREDDKIDLSLEPIGFKNYKDKNEQLIMDALEANHGQLPFSDKSDPNKIRKAFGLSKKAFKKAIGGLYRQRLIQIDEHQITKNKES